MLWSAALNCTDICGGEGKTVCRLSEWSLRIQRLLFSLWRGFLLSRQTYKCTKYFKFSQYFRLLTFNLLASFFSQVWFLQQNLQRSVKSMTQCLRERGRMVGDLKLAGLETGMIIIPQALCSLSTICSNTALFSPSYFFTLLCCTVLRTWCKAA